MSFVVVPPPDFLMMNSRRRRALITRPKEDASEVAIALVRRRITPLIEPMMRIEYTTLNIDAEISTAQALLFTSRNGVRAFARVSGQREKPVFAVGDSTAAFASDNGFGVVQNAGGDNTALGKLVIDQLSPSDGPLLHVAGVSVAGSLAETLTKTGFEVARRALYEAKPITALSKRTVTSIRSREIDYVLFFSPRTAKIFTEHIVSNKLEEECRDLLAICLSDLVARELSGLVWKELAVAKIPNFASLMQTIEEFESRFALPDDPTSFRSAESSSVSLDVSGPGVQPEVLFDPSRSAQTVDPNSLVEEDVPPRQDRQMAKPLPQESVSRPAPNPSHPRRRINWVAWALVLVLLVIPIAYLMLPYWNKYLPHHVRERFAASPQVNTLALKTTQIIERLRQDNNALRVRIDEVADDLGDAQAKLRENAVLVSRLTASEKLLAALKATHAKALSLAAEGTENSEKLSIRMETLEKSVEKTDRITRNDKVDPDQIDLKSAIEKSRLETTISDLNGRIVDLEKQLSTVRKGYSGTEKTSAVILAIGQLQDALSGSAPFVTQLTTLRRLVGQSPIIASILISIESFSTRGVPTKASLFADLPAAIDMTLKATRTPQEGDWVDRAVQRLQSFVTVRRIDGKGDGTDALIARTEMAARRGDLAGAVSQITKLQGSAAIVAKDWLAAARARIAVDQSIVSLNTATHSVLSPGRGP